MSEQAVETRPKHANQHLPAVTRLKQRTFLHSLIQHGSNGKACKAADIDEATPIKWASKSEQFAKAWDEAKLKGEKALLLRYETHLDKVLLPDEDMSIDDFARTQNSRFFRMKRLDPAYRDNAVVNVTANGPLAIQFNLGAQAIDNNSGSTPKEGV